MRKAKVKAGVYEIKNLKDGGVYIGASMNIGRRWGTHKYQLRRNKHYNKSLQDAWNRYGEKSFEFSVVEEIENKEPPFCLYELLAKEEHYINTAKSKYNAIATSRRAWDWNLIKEFLKAQKE